MEDLKQQAAQAALPYIEPHQRIGLGAGSTIAHLIEQVRALPFLDTLTFLTSSYTTKIRLKQAGLMSLETATISHIDRYFDSCDHYDAELNALKSGGGVHTQEKLLAAMSKEFILLVDESKYRERIIQAGTPLCIECLAQAESFVSHTLQTLYPSAKLQVRMGQNKDGAVISDNGHMLMDIWFHNALPLAQLNRTLQSVPGIIEHSLFYRLANKALVASNEGVAVLEAH